MTQLPDPELIKDVGVTAWLLVVIVTSGVATVAFFLRRITQAMDRMAVAHEAMPAHLAKLETLMIERLDRVEQKLDKSVELGAEQVRIGRMWERTEAPGRSIRPE